MTKKEFQEVICIFVRCKENKKIRLNEHEKELIKKYSEMLFEKQKPI